MSSVLNNKVGEKQQENTSMNQQNAHYHAPSTDLKRARSEYFQSQHPLEVMLQRKTGELLRAKSELKRKDLDNSRFISTISHDLVAPLEGILNSADTGMKKIEEMDRESLLQCFKMITENSRKVQSQLHALQELSDLEAGRIQYHFRYETISGLVQKVVDEFSVVSKEKNIAIKFNTSNFDDSAEVDQGRIIQVIRNLISNAIQYSEAGSTVTLEISDQKKSLSFSVIEDGLNMDEDDMEVLFEKSDNHCSVTEHEENLALAITKEIIADHNGEIWAEPNPEGGTILSFIIPKKHTNGTRQS